MELSKSQFELIKNENALLKYENLALQKQLEDKILKLEHSEQQTLILEEKREYLRFLLMRALRKQYTSRSERYENDDSQLSLPFFDEPMVEDPVSIEEIDEEISVASYKRKKGGRRNLPEWLPREQIIHDLKEEEKICACGHPLHKIGEAKSEQLEYIPARMKVIEHIRIQYGCRGCEEGVKTAELPAQIIPKSIATPSLLANVVIAKFQDHLPLYRQEQIWQRMGIDIARSTLCHWILKLGVAVLPLIELLKEELILCHYCQVDETPVQVLDQEGKAATSKSYMWVYASGPPAKPIVIYDYQPTRSGEMASQFLRDFRGYLQTDGYSGYNELRSRQEVTVLGCWAHARRKFYDVVKATKDSGKAQMALNLIQKLYRVERQCESLDTEGTYQLRQEKSKPILNRLKEFLEQLVNKVPPKSGLGEAISYTLNHWGSLNIYLTDGNLRIDNNYIENKIRPFALGRKNWLFIGNVEGAIASANLYSLIESAKANNLEPYYYLCYIFTKIPLCKSTGELKELLPHYCDPDVFFKI